MLESVLSGSAIEDDVPPSAGRSQDDRLVSERDDPFSTFSSSRDKFRNYLPNF